MSTQGNVTDSGNSKQSKSKNPNHYNENQGIPGSIVNNNKRNFQQRENIFPKEKSVVIMGDSKVKHVDWRDLIKKVKSNCKVYVKHFSGTMTNCIIGYSKAFPRDDIDHFILHVGTNGLKLEKTLECITESVTDLAVCLKNEKRDVSISIIIMRTDNHYVHRKAKKQDKAAAF